MIDYTELGVLISYEEWEMLQEELKQNGTVDSEELEKLRKENQGLRATLTQMNSFLTSEAEVEQ